jgi:hypothetical protein
MIDKKQKKTTPYLPIFHRQPNKFSHYEKERYATKSGIKATLNVAHYFDKNGKPSTMIAQVIWDIKP